MSLQLILKNFIDGSKHRSFSSRLSTFNQFHHQPVVDHCRAYRFLFLYATYPVPVPMLQIQVRPANFTISSIQFISELNLLCRLVVLHSFLLQSVETVLKRSLERLEALEACVNQDRCLYVRLRARYWHVSPDSDPFRRCRAAFIT